MANCSTPATVTVQVPAYTAPVTITPTQPTQPTQPVQGSTPSTPNYPHQCGATQNTVSFCWDAVPGATSYTYTDQFGYTNTITGTSTTLSGMQPGERIWARVRANNAYGSSAWSDYVYLTAVQPTVQLPAAPVAHSGGVTSQYALLLWNAVPGATKYVVADTYGGHFTTSGLYAHLTGVPAGATFQAHVAAVNSAGQGPWSSWITFTMPLYQVGPTPVATA